jgi:ribonuclease BN (tRNA processing enzyme)
MAYVTDTVASPTADYVRAIENVDLLIHECYFPDGYEEQATLTGHSCLTPVAQVAAAAKVKRCVLVHMNPLLANGDLPGFEKAKKIFAELHIGEDHQVWEI